MKKILLPVFCASLLLGANCGGGGTGPDADLDGSPDLEDCNPADASISPDQPEILNDGIDQDCSGADKLVTKSTQKSDNNMDGVTDQTNIYTYDANGNAVKSEASGVSNLLAEMTYDSEGHALVTTFDNGSDGTIDNIISNTYNSHGLLIHMTQDIADDGSIDDEFIYEFDAEERPLKTTVKKFGTTIITLTNSYDAAGNLVDKVNHNFTLPEHEYTNHSTYDASGYEIMNEFSIDGTLNNRSTYIYNADGQSASICEDTDLDGICNTTRIFSYHPDGTNAQTEVDGIGAAQSDGTIDMIIKHTVTSLPDGATKKSEERDNNADDTTDFVEYIINDANGNMLESGSDSNADGVSDGYIRYTYNEFNLETSITVDTNADGVVESASETSYEYSE